MMSFGRIGARALAVTSRRAPQLFASSARFLSNAAKSEFVEEKAILSDMDNTAPPEGWNVSYTKGKGFFRMTKATGGSEVVVDCEFKAHSSEDNTTGFTVLFTRNGITADFTLVYQAADHALRLEGMTTYHSKSTAVDLTPQAECDRDNHYEGPEVDDLEETPICPKVLELLEAHGVNADLGLFVHNKVLYLEQTAYCGFLEDLAKLSA